MLDYLLTALVFIFIFSLLILIHEFGHFWMAKRAEVKVEEFGLGLPPRIFGKKKGETLYSLNWIPFGGFVRLLGEDPTDKKSKDNPRSFSNKTPWQQLTIICGGVLMNFLLAFFLLTIGFFFGMEPLYASEEEFLDGMRAGDIQVEHGLYLEEENLVLYPGLDDLQTVTSENPPAEISIPAFQDGTFLEFSLTPEFWQDLEVRGLRVTHVPRLVYQGAEEGDFFSETLENGDVLLEVNGVTIFTEEDLFSTFSTSESLSGLVFRPGTGEIEFSGLLLPESAPLRIVEVSSGEPAEAAGLLPGDAVLTVEGESFGSIEELISFQTQFQPGESLTYEILHQGEVQSFEMTLNENQGIGVYLSQPIDRFQDMLFYNEYALVTITSIEPQKASWSAPVLAFTEMGRLGVLTAKSFIGVLRDIVSGQGIPDDVTGPVGIAQMTFFSVQEGFFSVLRLVALISLSLGVINILPIPAVDGGQLVFVLYRGFTGKQVRPSVQRWVNGIGFLLLLLFLILVTFNDLDLF